MRFVCLCDGKGEMRDFWARCFPQIHRGVCALNDLYKV